MDNEYIYPPSNIRPWDVYLRPSIEADICDNFVIKPGMKISTCAQWQPESIDSDSGKDDTPPIVFVKINENKWTTIHNCFGEEVLKLVYP